MIKPAPPHLRLSMGILSARLPAIRLHGIAVHRAIHVVQIIGCKP
jgi:hypothetical protein